MTHAKTLITGICVGIAGLASVVYTHHDTTEEYRTYIMEHYSERNEPETSIQMRQRLTSLGTTGMFQWLSELADSATRAQEEDIGTRYNNAEWIAKLLKLLDENALRSAYSGRFLRRTIDDLAELEASSEDPDTIQAIGGEVEKSITPYFSQLNQSEIFQDQSNGSEADQYRKSRIRNQIIERLAENTPTTKARALMNEAIVLANQVRTMPPSNDATQRSYTRDTAALIREARGKLEDANEIIERHSEEFEHEDTISLHKIADDIDNVDMEKDKHKQSLPPFR